MRKPPRIRATVPGAAILALAFACSPASPAAGSDTGGTGGAAYAGGPAGQVGSAGLHTTGTAMLGRPVALAGTTTPDTTVAVQRQDPRDGWVTAATGRTGADGAYRVVWRPDKAGQLTLRTVPAGGRAQTASTPPTVSISVYRPAQATWYGGSLMGHRTACGQVLTRSLIGVANRTLPCGTKVSFMYQGRTVVAPVVDRGPYGTGADWDLTAAAARKLGFIDAGRVTLGAMALRRR